MAHKGWTTEDMPDQSGRVAIVTGSNSGIGFETARGLANGGATVVLAVRDGTRGEEAAERIRAEDPSGSVEVLALDLADLSSVRSFSDVFHGRYERLDVLVNNAGVMMPPAGKTKDGFELQFGTNHLGHFALTGLLLDLLVSTPGSRVVTVSSGAHKFGKVDFDDLQWERKRYDRIRAYGQSKLANLLFTQELQRQLAGAGVETIAVAAHPGWTATNLQRDAALFRALNPLFGMKPWQGALPTLYAATAPEVRGGEYFGPDGLFEARGFPKRVDTSRAAKDAPAAARLWEISEELTEVDYEATLRRPASASRVATA